MRACAVVDGELEGQDVGAVWSPAHRSLEGCREGLPTIRKFSGAGMLSFRPLPSRINRTRLDSGGLVVPKGPSSSTCGGICTGGGLVARMGPQVAVVKPKNSLMDWLAFKTNRGCQPLGTPPRRGPTNFRLP